MPVRTAAPPASWDSTGPESGPTIVFVHGSRLTRASWRGVVDRLSDRYRCVCLDLPGHGDRAGEPFTLEAACLAVEAAIDAGIPDDGGGVILVGLSLGGYVAMAVAARRPERVRGLVVAGATAEPTGPTAGALRLFAWLLRRAPKRPFDAASSWYFRRRYPPEIAEPVVAAGYWSRGGSVAVATLPGERFRDRLEAYGGPILVINGDLDLVFRFAERGFLRGIPNVRRVVLPWTTHLSPLDRPAAFATAVARFAGRLPAAPSR